MAVNVKLGVDLGDFKQQVNQAKESIKSFDATLKFAESSFKATGDAEAKLTTKTTALNGKLKEQEKVVKAYADALQKARQQGIDPMSSEYQKLQTQMINAQAAMMDTQAALNDLTSSEQAAAQGATALEKSVNGIGKKMSLDQVISGLDKVQTGLENAAKKAIKLGEEIWNALMDKARWADDTMTMAQMYGIDVEEFQKMQKLVTNGMDTTVESMLSAQDKLKRNVGNASDTFMEDMRDLGLALEYSGKYGNELVIATQDSVELFWEAGKAIMALDDEYKKEAKSTELFGKSWKDLTALFEEYDSYDEYKKALETVNINSEEDVKALAELNDKVGELKGNLDTLSTDILATMAPGLSKLADSLNGVLTEVLNYLQEPEGQKKLDELSEAISGLFGDLSKIDPKKVIEGFVKAFDTVTGGIRWLVDNAETAKGILATVVGAWGTITIGENVLKVAKLIDGIRGLSGAEAATAGAAAGSSWGTAFAAAVVKVAPWLVGLYTMLNPAEGGNDAPFDNKTGQLTNEGWQQFYDFASGRMKDEAWQDVVNMVAERYGDMANILNDPAAINAMARAIYGDHSFIGVDSAAQPDLYMARINNELFDALDAMGYQPKIEIEPTEEVKEIMEKGTIELTVGDPTGRIKTPGGWKEPKVEVEPVPEDNSAEEISKKIGVVTIAAGISLVGVSEMLNGANTAVGDLDKAARAAIYKGLIPGFANGIPWVNDTQLAWLHRGERVLTAAQNRSYTANSNLYVENMHMGGGMDAKALAEAMSAQNRRVSAGFGS